MIYTTETANAIAQLHGVNPSTLRVWKSRGGVPEKYFDRDGNIIQPALMKQATDHQAGQVQRILKLREINAAKLTSITTTRYIDITRGLAALTESEVIEFKKEITQLRNLLRSVSAATTAAQTLTALKSGIKDRRVNWGLLAKRKGDITILRNGGNIEEDAVHAIRPKAAALEQALIF